MNIVETVLYGIIGWFAGVIVNYLADVLPYKRKLAQPFCIQCNHPMALTNYLLYPRQCEKCGHRRSIRTWLVEIAFIVISLWLHAMPWRLDYFVGLLLWLYFGVVFVIDVEHRLILHPVSIVGSIMSLVVGSYLHGWRATIGGGITGFAIMYLLYIFGNWFAGYISRRRGESLDEVALGFGDVNLSGVIGLLLGFPGIIGGILIAILLGGMFSLVYLVVSLLRKRYQMFTALPYAPFLVSSVLFLLFFR